MGAIPSISVRGVGAGVAAGSGSDEEDGTESDRLMVHPIKNAAIKAHIGRTECIPIIKLQRMV